MSDFNITFRVILHNESGYAEPFAASGETYGGIDRLHFPAWPGWQIIDAYKRQFGKPKRYSFLNIPELEQAVGNFYYNDYFKGLVDCSKISEQIIADFTGDFIFHKRYDAVKVINATAAYFKPGIATSNTSVTDDVVSLVNANPAPYYAAFFQNRIAYYQNPPAFGSNYKGFSPKLQTAFIDRVNKFPAALPAPGTFLTNNYWDFLKN